MDMVKADTKVSEV